MKKNIKSLYNKMYTKALITRKYTLLHTILSQLTIKLIIILKVIYWKQLSYILIISINCYMKTIIIIKEIYLLLQ